jgi:hypothetical protein
VRLVRLVLALAVACLCAPAAASAATSLIAAYDKYVPGQGFEIKLVDVGTGLEIPLPPGVNTADDEIHPAMTPGGRFLLFTRMHLAPQVNGDVVPPSSRSLMMVDRTTGEIRAPLSGEDLAGTGATITAGGHPSRLRPPAAVPEGRALAHAHPHGRGRLQQGQAVRVHSPPAGPPGDRGLGAGGER